MDVGGAHLAGVVVAAGGGGGGGAGGGGGPAPFLLKTYEMVDDPASDAVVSWSDASDSSFVVWNPPEFAARLLPTYFKHNNFSSFIRQLNTYGFRKIDPERWEFSNELFMKGQKHLLKNIHRRKPIHSHSNLPGSLPDAERAALEDEIDRLTRERTALQADLWRFKQQQSGAMIQIDDLERRVLDMEQRQLKMVAFLQQSSKNPRFIDNLIKMAEASSLFTDAFHKKRRLPGVDYCEATETSFYDDHSSSSKPDIGNLFNRDFCDKLKLGLCPAMTESNLLTGSTQSSYEDNGSPHGKHPECERMRIGCLPLVPQTLELSDTGTSVCPSKSVFLECTINEDRILPCHLSLTLASCSMEIDRSHISNANGSTIDHGTDNPVATTTATLGKEDQNGLGRLVGSNQKSSGDSGIAEVTTPQENAQPATAAPAVVNDKFWEQFLTERPGSSDTEEASSSLRRNPSGEQIENSKQGIEGTRNDRKDMQQLKL